MKARREVKLKWSNQELERVKHFKLLEIWFDKTTLDHGATAYCSVIDNLFKKFDKTLNNKISVFVCSGAFQSLTALRVEMGEQLLEEEWVEHVLVHKETNDPRT